MPKNRKIIYGVIALASILVAAGIWYIFFYKQIAIPIPIQRNLPTGLPAPYPITVFLKSDQAIQEIDNIQNEYVMPGFTYEKFVLVQVKIIKGDLKTLMEILKTDANFSFRHSIIEKNDGTLIIYDFYDKNNFQDEYIEKEINNFSSAQDSYNLSIISQKPYPILAYFLLPGGADERKAIKEKLNTNENIDKVCENFMLECLSNY